jgi:hypothetical protein
MTKTEKSLRNLLRWLEALTNQPSNLPKGKLNQEKIAALGLVARGWRRLAGEGEEDLEDLAKRVSMAMSPLFENLKQPPGRKPGARDQVLAETDKLVLAAIEKGSTIEKADTGGLWRPRFRRSFEAH